MTQVNKVNEMNIFHYKHVKTLNKNKKYDSRSNKSIGCGECQASCQSACKTSCTVANQQCENK